MGRDSHSTASSGGGGSSILTSILPCIRPRRSKPSTPEPQTSNNEASKRGTQDSAPRGSTRGPSFQSAGTTLELPNTPLSGDDGDGLEASVMREFARVSVQPISSPLLSEFGESESKPQETGGQQTPLAKLTDHRRNKTSDNVPPANNIPNIPQESTPDSNAKNNKSQIVEDVEPEDPKPISPTLPTETPRGTVQEVAQPDNPPEQTATEQDKSSKQEEASEQEGTSDPAEATESTEVPVGTTEKEASEPTQDEPSPGTESEDTKTSEPLPLELQTGTKDSIDKADEARDTSST